MKKLAEYKATIIFVLVVVLFIGGIALIEANKEWTAERLVKEQETAKAEKFARYSNVEESKYPIATITMNNDKVIKVKLRPDVAPTTVENFISLANSQFYNGLTFHRTMPDFVIQGGDKEGTGAGSSEYTIEGEFSANKVNNTLSHVKGVISMARGGYDNNSAYSQFFITTTDCTGLDGNYAAFGEVIEGLDVVDEIGNVEVITRDDESADANRPVNPPIIKSITVDTFGVTYAEPEKIVADNK